MSGGFIYLVHTGDATRSPTNGVTLVHRSWRLTRQDGEENACNTCVRTQGYTQCVLVSNTECEHNLFVNKKSSTGPL